MNEIKEASIYIMILLFVSMHLLQLMNDLVFEINDSVV